MEKMLINIKELSEYLGGVAVQTIYDWVHDKRIPICKSQQVSAIFQANY